MTEPATDLIQGIEEPASEATDDRRELVGLSMNQLTEVLAEIGEKPFRAKQLWHWIYHHGKTDFDEMSSLGKPLKAKLKDHFKVGRPGVVQRLISEDTSRKWLLRFGDNNEAESVWIPEEDRGALCVSSQVGCTLTCRFCHTGTQTLVRNLGVAEIVGQVMLARDDIGEWQSPPDGRMISNIVMMGMGEPLFNYDAVRDALKIIMDGDGISISKRRITLSTSGVVPEIEACGRDLGVNLAISLHAATDDVRNEIMPINKKYPLKDLLAACKAYPGSSNARRITFEYVMLKGINDSEADARALAQLVKGLPAKFNLIPFNKWPGSDYECSDDKTMQRFSEILNNAGYSAPIRTPRGRDIMAACGQLKSASERMRASRHKARLAAGIEDDHAPKG